MIPKNFKGSGTGTILTPGGLVDVDRVLKYFIITNMTAGVLTINIKIRKDTVVTQIAPKDMQLAVGECYTDNDIVLLTGEQVEVITSGTIDYYFSLP